MILNMIVNRTENWFYFEDVNLDPFYLAILTLKKLSSRIKTGIKYNRVELICSIADKKSEDALKAIDMSILLLASRNMISIREAKGECKIFITEHGTKLLEKYKGELKKCEF